MTTGKIPTLGFNAGAMAYVVLLGFSLPPVTPPVHQIRVAKDDRTLRVARASRVTRIPPERS